MTDYRVTAEQAAEFGRVAVIYGGNSSERSVSLKSGREVLDGLLRAGVDAFGLDLYGEDAQQDPIRQLLEARFDRAFLILHGPVGEDGTLQGVLRMMQKPFTGSAVAASALGMDKLRTKQLWKGAGLPTPDFMVLQQPEDLVRVESEIGFPVMVKPAHEGSSIGMAKAENAAQLRSAYEGAHAYDGLVLAERWMDGAEFTVAVLHGRALPAIRLETPHGFYDFDAKYSSNDTHYLFELGISAGQDAELKKLCEDAFRMIGCTGWARVDVMQDESGAFQLLEINTAPGMTDHSLVPMAAKQGGMGFSELVVEILKTAV